MGAHINSLLVTFIRNDKIELFEVEKSNELRGIQEGL